MVVAEVAIEPWVVVHRRVDCPVVVDSRDTEDRVAHHHLVVFPGAAAFQEAAVSRAAMVFQLAEGRAAFPAAAFLEIVRGERTQTVQQVQDVSVVDHPLVASLEVQASTTDVVRVQ